ncbi:HD domain-containing protein [Salinispora arenicola]|uniref:HD domain-containing protein n=1 Tax=Salinispora arenicola TaxID=168697 RepID=UPI0003643B5B|nr:HD domain-containing protein [Salinispora arenicola]
MHVVFNAESLLGFLAGLDGVYDAPPPLGDPVDLLAHGLQCAAVLRDERPDDLGLQLAGLVHDIGHAVGDDPDHARVGADVVRPVLGARVADLVALHVPAKRYLASTEPDYELSEASRLSLARQGSAMTGEEQERFLAHPAAADAVTLRRADEAAKIVGRQVPGLDVWAPRLRTYASGV